MSTGTRSDGGAQLGQDRLATDVRRRARRAPPRRRSRRRGGAGRRRRRGPVVTVLTRCSRRCTAIGVGRRGVACSHTRPSTIRPSGPAVGEPNATGPVLSILRTVRRGVDLAAERHDDAEALGGGRTGQDDRVEQVGGTVGAGGAARPVGAGDHDRGVAAVGQRAQHRDLLHRVGAGREHDALAARPAPAGAAGEVERVGQGEVRARQRQHGLGLEVEPGHLGKLLDELGGVERGHGALAAHRDRAAGGERRAPARGGASRSARSRRHHRASFYPCRDAVRDHRRGRDARPGSCAAAARRAGHDVLALSRAELDITDAGAVGGRSCGAARAGRGGQLRGLDRRRRGRERDERCARR